MKIELCLTKGMFGDRIETLCVSDDFDAVRNHIYKWKNSEKNKDNYKIEPYDRLICGKNGEIAVDFGDYCYFMLIKSDSGNLWKEITKNDDN